MQEKKQNQTAGKTLAVMEEKTIHCKKCSAENLPGTNYCQGCGEKLPKKRDLKTLLDSLDLKDIAGAGAKGVSAAPMAGRVVEDQARALGAGAGKSGRTAKVVPKSDGTWFCPDCGEHNRKSARTCLGCGRIL